MNIITKFLHFNTNNLLDNKTQIIDSPSKKYQIKIEHYKTGEHTWDYTKGIVKKSDGTIINKIYRNYHVFWYCWVEEHQDGHDYLLCGEDYQGQTIIQLDTGLRKDTMSKNHEKGFGFCWAACAASPNKTLLAVDGCVWAGPYEVVIYDFSKPMEEIKELKAYEACEEFCEWVDNNTISIGHEEDFRKSDGVLVEDLSIDEYNLAADNDDLDCRKVKHEVKIKE
jgi:hypothetical protein